MINSKFLNGLHELMCSYNNLMVGLAEYIKQIQEYNEEFGDIQCILELAEIDFVTSGKPMSNNPIYLYGYDLAKKKHSIFLESDEMNS